MIRMNTDRCVKIWKAALYLRLSKEDGDIAAGCAAERGGRKFQSGSIANQEEYIRDYLKKKKPKVRAVRCFQDDGYSGVNFDRPGFQEMIKQIRDGEIDCVVVKDLSRLGRNYIETGKYMERIFPALGVRFIAVNDHYDSLDETNGADYMIVPFKNLINDAYCRDISIKIRSHLEIKRLNGEFVGAFPAFGYQKDPQNKNHLIIDEYAAQIVRMIYRMKLEGYNQQAIADRLNQNGILSPAAYKKETGGACRAENRSNAGGQWTPTAVSRILSNEVYTGALVQGKAGTPNYKVKKRLKRPESEWVRAEQAHEAVIPPADYELVKEIMSRDTRAGAESCRVSAYGGYIYCAGCNSSMVKKRVPSGKNRYTYYVCSAHKKEKLFCKSHAINEKKLNEAVLLTVQMQIRYLTEDARPEVWEKTGAPRMTRELLVRLVRKISVYEDNRIEIVFRYREDETLRKAAFQYLCM